MKLLVEIITAIGAEKWVTISVIQPVIHKLLEVYKSGDSRLEITMKEAIHSNFQQHYKGSTLTLPNKAASLDPQFKSLLFLFDEDQQTIASSVEAEVAKLVQSNSTSSTSYISPM